MAAFRTLWTALFGLYEETLVLVAGNLAAVALNLPIGLVLFFIVLPFVSNAEQPGTQWLILVIAWLMPFLPTPGNVALARLTQVAAGPDAPRLHHFREGLRSFWRLALPCSVISLVVLMAMIWNITFYVAFGPGWPLLVSILWLYASLFWLGLHLFLAPLIVHLSGPRVVDLYRRAAFVALGHGGYTFVLLMVLLALTFAAVLFLPVYVLVAPAFVSLTQAHALREIRRRHGDLVAEPEEEVSRL
jgi:hypothetical protein